MSTDEAKSTRRAELLAAPYALLSRSILAAYRERRVFLTQAKLAKDAGISSGERLAQMLSTPFKATADVIQQCERLARALGVEGDGPFYQIVPAEVMAERFERERINRLLPPAPKRPSKALWDAWAAECRAIIEAERAKRRS